MLSSCSANCHPGCSFWSNTPTSSTTHLKVECLWKAPCVTLFAAIARQKQLKITARLFSVVRCGHLFRLLQHDWSLSTMGLRFPFARSEFPRPFLFSWERLFLTPLLSIIDPGFCFSSYWAYTYEMAWSACGEDKPVLLMFMLNQFQSFLSIFLLFLLQNLSAVNWKVLIKCLEMQSCSSHKHVLWKPCRWYLL